VLAQLHRPHRRSIGFDAVLSRKSELRLGITSRRSSIVLLVSRNAVLCVAHPGSKRALPVGSSRKTGVGSGACGQGFESPCARAATGSPAGHYDPSRSLQRKVREPGGRQTSRRSAERRASCVTGREAPRFRCFSRAASWHANGAAIRTSASRRFALSPFEGTGGETTVARMKSGHGEETQSPARNGRRDHRDDRRGGRSVAV
jgi:hypothetical protein